MVRRKAELGPTLEPDPRDPEHADVDCTDSEAPERVLLVNPPVYDVRLPWAKWQQPTSLLRAGTHFRKQGSDVRLIDALHHPREERLRREQLKVLNQDGIRVAKWRFGISAAAIRQKLLSWKKDEWTPNSVHVECFTTFWWEGAREAIDAVRNVFPAARITLLGAYPALAPEHAMTSAGADDTRHPVPGGSDRLPADLALYDQPPTFAYVSLGSDSRTVGDIVEEIHAARTRGVRDLAFADHAPLRVCPQLFLSVLERLAAWSRRPRLHALGSISARDLIDHPEAASLMKKAGYFEICFSDDRDSVPGGETASELIENYRQAAELCREAGFPERAEALSGAISIGRPGEDLEERIRTMTLIAHHIGAVIPWPYQPAPCHFSEDTPLEDQNGKLFPLRHKNDLTYRDYLEVLSLATLLNSKYRHCTFDYLGSGLISRMFRNSLERRAWDPDPEIKGTLKLPVMRPQ